MVKRLNEAEKIEIELHNTFDATLKKDNKNIRAKYRETHLWRREDDKWRLAEVHDSNLPVDGTQQSF